MDVGANEMGRLQSAIADLVARRQHLKRNMQRWYAAHPRDRFSRWPELEQIDNELSELDRRFKRL